VNVPRLIALTDRSVASASVTLARFERLALAARPGTVLLQLRDRELAVRERLAFGRELRALATRTGQLLQVNDRLDLALLLDADAVHLGEGSVGAMEARRLVGAERFVTRACHAPDAAAEPGVDGWLVSPIFAARKGRDALGLGVLGEMHPRQPTAAGSVGRPYVYALGGVNAENAAACLSAGAAGVAVIGAALGVEDPQPLVEALGVAR
jgi:thiamine-phosphate diphosphorylase